MHVDVNNVREELVPDQLNLADVLFDMRSDFFQVAAAFIGNLEALLSLGVAINDASARRLSTITLGCGTTNTVWQTLHLAFLPANSSGSAYLWPHCSHSTEIGMATSALIRTNSAIGGSYPRSFAFTSRRGACHTHCPVVGACRDCKWDDVFRHTGRQLAFGYLG